MDSTNFSQRVFSSILPPLFSPTFFGWVIGFVFGVALKSPSQVPHDKVSPNFRLTCFSAPSTSDCHKTQPAAREMVITQFEHRREWPQPALTPSHPSELHHHENTWRIVLNPNTKFNLVCGAPPPPPLPPKIAPTRWNKFTPRHLASISFSKK